MRISDWSSDVCSSDLDPPASAHCGSCTRCIEVCPTQAILGPYRLDAKRCISYLTIELKGSIPEDLRAPMGNRIFGCDDCQLVCPWNKFAQATAEPDFAPRSEERRVGKECVSTGSSRWSPAT